MNLPVRHPDDLARYYLQLGEQRGAVQAQRIADAVGQQCGLCAGGPMTRVSNGDDRPGRKKWREVCASCGDPWVGEEIHVLRQHDKHAPARPVSSDPSWFEDWRRVQPIIEHRPRDLAQGRWDFCIVSWLAFLAPTIGTYDRAAQFGATRIPDEHWTTARVRSAIETARYYVEKRGVREGVIVGRAEVARARG